MSNTITYECVNQSDMQDTLQDVLFRKLIANQSNYIFKELVLSYTSRKYYYKGNIDSMFIMIEPNAGDRLGKIIYIPSHAYPAEGTCISLSSYNLKYSKLEFIDCIYFGESKYENNKWLIEWIPEGQKMKFAIYSIYGASGYSTLYYELISTMPESDTIETNNELYTQTYFSNTASTNYNYFPLKSVLDKRVYTSSSSTITTRPFSKTLYDSRDVILISGKYKNMLYNYEKSFN